MIGTVITLAFIATIWFGFNSLWNWGNEQQLAEGSNSSVADAKETNQKKENGSENINTNQDDTAEELSRLDKVLSEINEDELQLDIDANTSQSKVVDVMHQMVHQKVRAEKKWGKIPMHPDTIAQVYMVVKNSNFDNKATLLGILENWKDKDFSKAVNDHNYFWEYQDGTVGKATASLSISEEIAYVESNFQ